ncbi:hypothetical protein CYY_001550 [Polysphondylium violaceum]|uniref:NADH dehydrogenase [ubiquinone] 1 alpha subcomplex assembly factor 3 n=1 Tax=Polysphondylium violaceum TaxID=133409 RepID=A0A8J4Q0X2_9MYCE|nr:hypothetical protein CYY_001550 [Polysphondylium violaceum]
MIKNIIKLQSSRVYLNRISSPLTTYTSIVLNKNQLYSNGGNNNNNKSQLNSNSSRNDESKRYYCKGLSNRGMVEENKGELANVYSIDAYSDAGFSVNKVLIPGSIAVMPDKLFLWDIHSYKDITAETLALIDLVDPPLEFIILGTGKNIEPIPHDTILKIQSHYKVSVEIMSTFNAIGTYNILAEEGRNIAAFLIPVQPIGSEFRVPHLVSKEDYEPKIAIDQAAIKGTIRNTVQKKKQILLKMKLEEAKREMENSNNNNNNNNNIDSIDSSNNNNNNNDQDIVSKLAQDKDIKKEFGEVYIPTRNNDVGYTLKDKEDKDSSKLSQTILMEEKNTSLTSRFIVWAVKTFFSTKK